MFELEEMIGSSASGNWIIEELPNGLSKFQLQSFSVFFSLVEVSRTKMKNTSCVPGTALNRNRTVSLVWLYMRMKQRCLR